jgi:DNA (cytosine-5)-methyltransferase 1
MPRRARSLTCLDFFAGSGLVTCALGPRFRTVWANDVCPKKARVFRANHDKVPFALESITEVRGRELPRADLAWASFPCQDLSLAGPISGINGQRSGLVWQWLRVIDEMAHKPPVIVAENVFGLVSSDSGRNYRLLHQALVDRGFAAGPLLLDAIHFLPQSRPRVFVVAAQKGVRIPLELRSDAPNWLHPPPVARAAAGLTDLVWWRLQKPPARARLLVDLLEDGAPCHDTATRDRNLALIPDRHRRRLDSLNGGLVVAPGYRRMRDGRQTLELRFDGVAGCLRTPRGGSSRQILILKKRRQLQTRLLTVKELGRLMGAPDNYQLPGSYNDAYHAMGDAVAVPVARYLADRLLAPLLERKG